MSFASVLFGAPYMAINVSCTVQRWIFPRHDNVDPMLLPLLRAGALLRMGDHRLPKRVMPGELENAGKRGPGGKEKEWTDCVADDLRLFGVTGTEEPPHLTLGHGITRFKKGVVVGLWPRG